jgi:ribosomal-protein-alanine N-acetyltransferase
MEISYEGVILRPWNIKDAKELAEIANNRKISNNLRDGLPYPYTRKDAINWLNIILPENNPPRFFAILVDNEIVGNIGLTKKKDIYRKNIEIGYFLSEKHWGKGIATRAIKAATSYAFNTFDIIRVFAESFSDNMGSRRALEKAGFRLEATLTKNIIKNNDIKDSCIYSVLKENWKF